MRRGMLREAEEAALFCASRERRDTVRQLFTGASQTRWQRERIGAEGESPLTAEGEEGAGERSDVGWRAEGTEIAMGSALLIAGAIWMPQSWFPDLFLFGGSFLIMLRVMMRSSRPRAARVGGLIALADLLLLALRAQMQQEVALLPLLLEPFCLLVTCLLMSPVIEAEKSRLSLLKEQQIRSRAMLQHCTKSCQALLAINEALEKEVACLPTSLTSISRKLIALWELSGQQREAEMLSIIRQAVGATSCALYSQQGQQLVLSAVHQSDQAAGRDSYQRILETKDPLIGQVLQHRWVCTIRDVLAEGQQVGAESAVMAGPLVLANGEIRAVVVIADLPFCNYSPGVVRLFGALLQLMALALQAQRPSGEEERGGALSELSGKTRMMPRRSRLRQVVTVQQ